MVAVKAIEVGSDQSRDNIEGEFIDSWRHSQAYVVHGIALLFAFCVVLFHAWIFYRL